MEVSLDNLWRFRLKYLPWLEANPTAPEAEWLRPWIDCVRKKPNVLSRDNVYLPYIRRLQAAEARIKTMGKAASAGFWTRLFHPSHENK